MAERPDPARFCFGCGAENPRGLALEFRLEHGRAVAEFAPADYLQGYPGFVHGGVVATMLDEAMSWAAYGQGIWAMTARLTMRFRKSVPLNEPLVVDVFGLLDSELRHPTSQPNARRADGHGIVRIRAVTSVGLP